MKMRIRVSARRKATLRKAISKCYDAIDDFEAEIDGGEVASDMKNRLDEFAQLFDIKKY